MNKTITKGAKLRLVDTNDASVKYFTDEEIVVSNDSVIGAVACHCGSHDCTGHAFIFKNEEGQAFMVHDADLEQSEHHDDKAA